MRAKIPTVATHYVGTMLAFMAMRSLSMNLAAYFAGAADEVSEALAAKRPVPDYPALIRELMVRSLEATEDHLVTDLKPGEYDADQAIEIALDMVGRANELIIKAAGLK
ncbi:MAG: hypothetical protein HY834_09050 [Devosia nanyangense]|uniref:Uncharacterized protein n=1 Tax=Devosia nanyangense TaxID=1228055 RepID=A0A933L0T1_9HYPH|nr:hypothetical protein [Devosia nanyangense]